MRNLVSSQDSKRTRPGSPCCLLAPVCTFPDENTEPLQLVQVAVLPVILLKTLHGLLYPFALASFLYLIPLSDVSENISQKEL